MSRADGRIGSCGRKPTELTKEFGCHATRIPGLVRMAGVEHGITPTLLATLNADQRDELIEQRRKLRQVHIAHDILANAAAWFAVNTDKTFTLSMR